MKSQTDNLLSYLHLYGSVTPLEALRDLGCMRLAARVRELRQRGHVIETNTVKADNGKRYAEYQLVA